MTDSQACWASRHDWFIRSYIGGAEGEEGWIVVARGELEEPEEVKFNDYQALRAWAGY